MQSDDEASSWSLPPPLHHFANEWAHPLSIITIARCVLEQAHLSHATLVAHIMH